jgi:hypothetical protein
VIVGSFFDNKPIIELLNGSTWSGNDMDTDIDAAIYAIFVTVSWGGRFLKKLSCTDDPNVIKGNIITGVYIRIPVRVAALKIVSALR